LEFNRNSCKITTDRTNKKNKRKIWGSSYSSRRNKKDRSQNIKRKQMIYWERIHVERRKSIYAEEWGVENRLHYNVLVAKHGCR